MTLIERIKETFNHYDYVIVKCSGYEHTNVLVVDSTVGRVFNYLTIVFGSDRVSRSQGGVKIAEESKLWEQLKRR